MNRSVYTKTLILILSTVVFVSVSAMIYFIGTLGRLQDQQIQNKAREMADIVSSSIDIDTVKTFKSMVPVHETQGHEA